MHHAVGQASAVDQLLLDGHRIRVFGADQLAFARHLLRADRLNCLATVELYLHRWSTGLSSRKRPRSRALFPQSYPVYAEKVPRYLGLPRT